MRKGALIGEGMTAEVYEWGKDKVLKLYHDRFTEEWASREAEVGRAVYDAGVPSPEVFGTVEVDGRMGVVFQRFSGRSVFEHIILEPYMLLHYTKKVAALHYSIHRCTSDRLPCQMKRFENTIGFSAGLLGEKTERILDYLRRLPDGSNVCHGDLHFDNIIISGKRFMPIDWSSAYRGNPLSDVARTCLIITSPAAPPGTPEILVRLSQHIKHMLYRTYLEEYMRLAKVRFADIDEWILPVAAAKLRDMVPGEKKWLMSLINSRLQIYEKSELHEVKPE